MNWIEHLNQVTGRLSVGDATIEARSWAYSSHLADNVPHRHTYFEVCLVGQWGNGVYRVEGVPYPLVPGTLFIARPGILHQIINSAEPNMELYWVCFQWAGTTGKDSEIDALFSAFARSSLLTLPDHSHYLLSLWKSLQLTAEVMGQSDCQEPGVVPQLRALMAVLLIAIARMGTDLPPSSVPTTSPIDSSGLQARHAVRFIHNNLHRPLSVMEVAQEVGLSERQLNRLFVRVVGTSPATYITQARMDRGGTLLLKTDDPIKQIASLLGYDDIHHFTRVFTRVMGCPPGQFRRRGGGPKSRYASPETIGELVW
jgi:AraC family L-rhamnose operon transcriptional activator RhaR